MILCRYLCRIGDLFVWSCARSLLVQCGSACSVLLISGGVLFSIFVSVCRWCVLVSSVHPVIVLSMELFAYEFWTN